VQNLDFGHTDPQIVMPLGGKARVAAAEEKIYLTY
jgi:muramoyltetrapeptide carboxypeptidase LdcA involved in peptidoglycan recycling